VPLLACGPPCDWWDRVLINFRAWTSAAHFDGDLGLYVDLHPAANPDERPYNYTPTLDPWKVWTLQEAVRVRDFYSYMYGFTPASVHLFYGSPISADLGDGIAWGDSYASVASGEDEAAEWVLAHEYAHMLTFTINGENLPGCNSTHHSACNAALPCPEGAWKEGIADGMADFYVQWIYPQHPFWVFNYSCNNPNPGIFYESNVETFVRLMSEREPRDFMDTFRYGRLTLADPTITYTAHTAGQYYDLWLDVDPSPLHILTHHPGPWNADAIWAGAIGLEVSGVGTTNGGATSRGIVSVNPLPASSRISIRLYAPPSSAGEVDVYTISGRLVQRARWIQSNAALRTVKVDVTGLPNGVYFAAARGSDGRTIGRARKLVVVR